MPSGNITTHLNTCLLQAVVDPLNNRTTYAYGRFPTPISVQNALNYLTTFTLDNMGYQVAVTDALGYSVTTIYNPAHQRIASQDQLGFLTTYGFDNGGRPQTVQNARGYVTTTVYNARDAIARIDALGNRWTTVYDALARSIASVTPLGFTNTTVYDAASKSPPASMRDFNRIS